MFKFLDNFNYLTDDEIKLKITEKHYGDSDILPFYYYDIFNKDDIFVGKISIRIGNNYNSYYNGHIGYEVFEKHRGNNYSFYATQLIKEVAKAHKMAELYLTCKESNFASRKIFEKLGAIKKILLKYQKIVSFIMME